MELVDVIYNFNLLTYFEYTPKNKGEEEVLHQELLKMLSKEDLYKPLMWFIRGSSVNDKEKARVLLSLVEKCPKHNLPEFYRVVRETLYRNMKCFNQDEMLSIIDKNNLHLLENYLLQTWLISNELTNRFFLDALFKSIYFYENNERNGENTRILFDISLFGNSEDMDKNFKFLKEVNEYSIDKKILIRYTITNVGYSESLAKIRKETPLLKNLDYDINVENFD